MMIVLSPERNTTATERGDVSRDFSPSPGVATPRLRPASHRVRRSFDPSRATGADSATTQEANRRRRGPREADSSQSDRAPGGRRPGRRRDRHEEAARRFEPGDFHARPRHRRVAVEGEDDQQIPRQQLQGAGELRPRPRPAAPPQEGRGRRRRGHRRGLGAHLCRRRTRRGQEQGPAHGQGHPRRAEQGGEKSPTGSSSPPTPTARARPSPGTSRTPSASTTSRTFRVAFNEITRSAAIQAAGQPRQDRHATASRPRRRGASSTASWAIRSAACSWQEGHASTAERRAGAVGGAAPRRRPRTRDRGVQAGGILEDDGAAGAEGVTVSPAKASPARAPLSVHPRAGKKADRASPEDHQPRTPGQDAKRRLKEPRAAPPEVPEGTYPGRAGRVGRPSSSRTTRRRRAHHRPALDTARYVVAKVEQKDSTEKAPPPFTTSTLQQQANIRCTSPPSGRCRRPSACTKASTSARRRVRSRSLPTCVPTARASPTEALKRGARRTSLRLRQAGVPAGEGEYVRLGQERAGGPRGDPSDRPGVHAGARRPSGSAGDQLRLYTLIWPFRRQPDDAGRLRRHQRGGDGRPSGAADGQPALFQGDGSVQGQGAGTEVRRLPARPGARGKQEDADLPNVAEGQQARSPRPDGEPALHQAAAALQRGVAGQGALEKEGIGRPSTYATIISKITSEERGYIEVRERRFLRHRAIGKTVTDLLVEHFPRHGPEVHVHMEEELDEIEGRGKRKYRATSWTSSGGRSPRR